MSKAKRTLEKVLTGKTDANVDFDDLCHLLHVLGFSERQKGSHHIFYRDGIDEIVNIQPLGRLAKRYQVRQVRNIILKYKLGVSDE
ncbi:MAG: type II toxin-antitoxin system HicA family toxin [Pyrinomonadaceae bacterium]